MRSHRGNQPWVRGIELLESEPPVLLHEIDQAQIPRTHDDGVVLGAILGLGIGISLWAGGLRHGQADHGRLLVASGHVRRRAGGERAFDQICEAVAVSLLERRPLRLAVVGQDDDLVGGRAANRRARSIRPNC